MELNALCLRKWNVLFCVAAVIAMQMILNCISILHSVSTNAISKRISACLSDISNWLPTHHLKPNLDKTELLFFLHHPSWRSHSCCLQVCKNVWCHIRWPLKMQAAKLQSISTARTSGNSFEWWLKQIGESLFDSVHSRLLHCRVSVLHILFYCAL